MKGTKWILTDRQEAYLVKHFKHTRNADLAAKLGISEAALHRFARQFGLKKTKQFMRKMQANTAAKARESHLAFNTYPPKGYRIPRSEEFWYKPGESIKERIGEKRWKAAMEKASESRKKTWRIEHVRATFGLPQKTKLRVKRQPKQKILDRCYLKKRGYILDEENNVAYWTPETRRATRMEARPKRYYRFAEFLTER